MSCYLSPKVRIRRSAAERRFRGEENRRRLYLSRRSRATAAQRRKMRLGREYRDGLRVGVLVGLVAFGLVGVADYGAPWAGV